VTKRFRTRIILGSGGYDEQAAGGSDPGPTVSMGENLSRVECDLIRKVFDPDDEVPLFLRFGLVLWLAERYYPPST
jgi:hypothetical protein